MKTEAPVGESHVGFKKSVQAAPGFTRQAVGIRLGRALSTAAIEVTWGLTAIR